MARSVSQSVSHLSLTTEPEFDFSAGSVGFCGVKRGFETGVFQSDTYFLLSVIPLIYQYTVEFVTERVVKYRCADKFLARPTSRCILFDG